MDQFEDNRVTFEEYLNTIGVDATIQDDPDRTIVPEQLGQTTRNNNAFKLLRELGQSAGGLEAQLELGRTLGQGGMGLVRLANQVALGRKVAVKSLQPEHTSNEHFAMELLREAWVTGALEHPNVVPVYTLGLDEYGAPLIVLKRIEGRNWRSFMHDPESVRSTFGINDVLQWHLGVLKQVCNAVQYAHRHGIIHRDIKPDNVMVGEFGEVYVVDWGIAVSLQEDNTGRLPLARESQGLAGTPAYLAPEMIRDASEVAPTTDVYLLGAVLHEILTGHPPHLGESLAQVLWSSSQSPARDYPADTPAELVALANWAMTADQGERCPSADVFQQALVTHENHRHSARMAAEASLRLRKLKAAVHEDNWSGDDEAAQEARHQLYALFSECRFAFKQATKEWEENPAAKIGLSEAIRLMITVELAEHDVRAAAALLAQLAEPPSDLSVQLEELRDELSMKLAEDTAWIARGRRMDRDIGRRTRAFHAALMSVIWVGFPLMGLFVPDEYNLMYSYEKMVLIPPILIAFLGGFFIWARDTLTKTRFNLNITLILGASFLAQEVMVLAAWRLNLEFPVIWSFHMFLWFVTALFIAVLLEPIASIAAVAYLCSFVFSLEHPTSWFVSSAICNALACLSVFIAWRPPEWRLRTLLAGLRQKR